MDETSQLRLRCSSLIESHQNQEPSQAVPRKRAGDTVKDAGGVVFNTGLGKFLATRHAGLGKAAEPRLHDGQVRQAHRQPVRQTREGRQSLCATTIRVKRRC